MRKIIGFAAGFTLGALAGAVVGLLLAPQSASDLRWAMRERAQTVLDDARQAAAERRAELSWRFAEAKQLPLRQAEHPQPWEPPQSLS
jgi:gas vesicle protein